MQTSTSTTSKITISGLVGFDTSDSSTQNPVALVPIEGNSVDQLFYSESVANRVEWKKTAGTIILEIGNGKTMAAGDDYVFSFKLVNPGSDKTSPNIEIAASGSYAIPKTQMDKATGESAPLLVTAPKFVTAKVHFFVVDWGCREGN